MFVLDFFMEETNIVRVPTKASLIVSSLMNEQADCLYRGEWPESIAKRSSTWKKIRWWLIPILVMVMCWLLLICPDEFASHYFQNSIFDPKWFEKNQVKKYLPIIPENLS